MLGDVLGDDKDDNAGAPLPTGTFRENDNKKEDDGWGRIANSSGRKKDDGWGGFGSGRPQTGGPKSGSKADEEDDLLENILDDIEEKKGIETTKPRPKTAVEH